ncbi:TraB/GumN family protein [Chitinimonas sp.]|uniref:TraB/GumN family protein n=1 Tax=Chitinimonas sp. TaxID=1934313 RepID=UPI0035AE5054
MSRMFRAGLLCLLALVALSVHARLFLWDAERDGKHISLLGSIHLGRADFYPLAEPIETAFARADTLVVEADVSDPAAIAPLMPMTLLPEGLQLGSLLSAKQKRQLDQALLRTGLPRASAERMKPWFLALTLSSLDMQAAGLATDQGIDLHYLRRARQQGKQIVELESAKGQFSLLDQLPQADAIALLAASLDPATVKQIKPQLDAMLRAWQSGDAKAMRRVLDADIPRNDPAMRRVSDKLFGLRNRAMLEKIEALAGQPAPLVVVGAGHLAGPDNLIDMLKARGYRVTQY